MPLTIIVWLVLCLIWGTTWIVIKIGLGALPPIGFAAMRFLLATAILFVVLRVRRIALPRSGREWRLLALTGVLQFSVTYSLVFWCEQYITSGLTAVLQAMISVFGLLLAWKFLPGEKITRQKVLAVAVGMVGVAAIFSDQLRVQSVMAFLGSIGVVISAYSAAQSSILVKAKSSGLHPGVLLFGQMICGLPPIVAYSLIVEGSPLDYRWNWTAVAAIAYLAIAGTVAAFWLFYWLLSRVESSLAMMISVVTPLIAVLIGWAVLGETLPPGTLIGGVLVMTSVVLTMSRGRSA